MFPEGGETMKKIQAEYTAVVDWGRTFYGPFVSERHCVMLQLCHLLVVVAFVFEFSDSED